jgi:hypothetical protein
LRSRGGTTARIIGAHSIIYSTNPDADRAFLRDVLELPHVDVGGGWLVFGLPLAEVAVQKESWGLLTRLTLPGGGKLGIYQPRHARPKAMSARRAAATSGPKKKTPGRGVQFTSSTLPMCSPLSR